MKKVSVSGKVGCGITCDLTLDETGNITACWYPDLPHKLKKKQRLKVLDEYRKLRDQLIVEFENETGEKVTIVEL